MNIEVNAVYELRGGEEIIVLSINGPDPLYPIVGHIRGETMMRIWQISGKYDNIPSPQPLDIILPNSTFYRRKWVLRRTGNLVTALSWESDKTIWDDTWADPMDVSDKSTEWEEYSI